MATPIRLAVLLQKYNIQVVDITPKSSFDKFAQELSMENL